jgi:type VI protein secretion system component Hcp
MNDENKKQNEVVPQASDTTELTENDLAGVNGGDSATNVPVKETVSFNYSKIEFKYTQ